MSGSTDDDFMKSILIVYNDSYLHDFTWSAGDVIVLRMSLSRYKEVHGRQDLVNQSLMLVILDGVTVEDLQSDAESWALLSAARATYGAGFVVANDSQSQAHEYERIAKKGPFPCSPVLLPDGSGVYCPYDATRFWRPAFNERPNCLPCAAAWRRIEKENGKTP